MGHSQTPDGLHERAVNTICHALIGRSQLGFACAGEPDTDETESRFLKPNIKGDGNGVSIFCGGGVLPVGFCWLQRQNNAFADFDVARCCAGDFASAGYRNSCRNPGECFAQRRRRWKMGCHAG
jgi:hypothetical protein